MTFYSTMALEARDAQSKLKMIFLSTLMNLHRKMFEDDGKLRSGVVKFGLKRDHESDALCGGIIEFLPAKTKKKTLAIFSVRSFEAAEAAELCVPGTEVIFEPNDIKNFKVRVSEVETSNNFCPFRFFKCVQIFILIQVQA